MSSNLSLNAFCHQNRSGQPVSMLSSCPVAIVPTSAARDRLTDAAVARLLSISKRTLLRWLKSGVVDPPALVTGKQRRRCWTEHEVAHLLELRKRGISVDSTRGFQPAGRRGEDHHRRYFGKILRRQRQEGAAD